MRAIKSCARLRTRSEALGTRGGWRATAVVRNGDVGDWRLDDERFLETFHLPKREDCGPLARANPLARDGRTTFEEVPHTYKIDRMLAPRSVTGLLHEYTSEFNAERALRAMKQGRG